MWDHPLLPCGDSTFVIRDFPGQHNAPYTSSPNVMLEVNRLPTGAEPTLFFFTSRYPKQPEASQNLVLESRTTDGDLISRSCGC